MDLNALMSQLGPMQEAMKQADSERQAAKIEGKAGGGAITITITGGLEVEKVAIAPAAAAAVGDDPTMLEDLIAVAMGDALKQYTARFGSSPEEQIQKMMGNSPLGAMLGPLMGGMS